MGTAVSPLSGGRSVEFAGLRLHPPITVHLLPYPAALFQRPRDAPRAKWGCREPRVQGMLYSQTPWVQEYHVLLTVTTSLLFMIAMLLLHCY